MTIDLTRRTLLQLAGAATLTVAAAAAARAEGMTGAEMTAAPAGPTFANRTPMRVGMVTLRVRDLDRVANFYRDVIGLAVIERNGTAAKLGAGGVALLILEARPEAPFGAQDTAGLFHTAFLMPTRKDLARWLVHVARHRVPLSGFADHLVSESVYLNDPEGNGIEVYADRAPAAWKWQNGVVAMATDPLNIDDLLTLTDIKVSDYAGAPDGLRIGHIHLRVGDIQKAETFYRAAIGLDVTRKREGASFLSSGRYHHHVATNVWQSQGAGPRSDGETGLAWFSLDVEKADILAAQRQRLATIGAKVETLGNGIETADPWGTRIRLIAI
jgi:catechol 2,3-dioxygenase